MENVESSFFTGAAANEPPPPWDDKTAALARCLRLLIELHRLQEELAGVAAARRPRRVARG